MEPPNAPAPGVNPARTPVPALTSAANDGFWQAMLKTALETIPQLTEENYSIWKDKMTALLKLRGALQALNNPAIPLGEGDNAELTMLLLSKIDSVTHNNVVTADNSESAQKIWLSIKERFASSQSSNRARMFNDFLYVKFQEDAVETFVTNIKVTIKKMVDVGIKLPEDILAYLVLFKFPNSLQNLKRQIMHSDKDLDVKFVCNHLIQFNNESRAESKEKDVSNTEAVLFSQKGKSKSNGQSNQSKRCRNGYHNPKQDENHSKDNCWHLHPEVAPDWWKESQAQWKAGKEKEKKENYFMSLLTLWIESGDPKNRIILDSGASTHIFNDKKFFDSIERGNFDVIKTGKKDATLPIKGKGSVRLSWGGKTITLNNCLFVPDIVINLISAGQLTEKGCTLTAKKSKFSVSKDGCVAFEGKVNNGLFSVNNPDHAGRDFESSVNVAHEKESIEDVHEKLGHASIHRIESFLDPSTTRREKDNFECKACVLAKITKQSFKAQSTLASKPFERLHLDLIGPIKPESSSKHRFILTVVDNHSGYLAGFPLVHKNDTTDTLINLLESEKTRRGYFPSMICSDGGGEFVGNRAERANRTIVESMRATHSASNIPKRFWHEILKSCCLALNQIPKKGMDKSPWEILHDRKFPDKLLKPLGTPTIILNQVRTKGRKFDEKGEEGKLIGFNPSLLSYRVLTPFGRIVETKHVRFLRKINGSPKLDLDIEEGFQSPLEEQKDQFDNSQSPVNQSSSSNHGENESDQEDSSNSSQNEQDEEEINNQLVQNFPKPQNSTPIITTRTLRDRSQLKPPMRYGFHHYFEPNTFESAIRCEDAKHWKKAIEKENIFSCGRSNSGMRFEREDNKIKLSLPNHIQHGLEELGLTSCKTSITPLTPNLKLRDATDEEHDQFKKLNINYRSAIGLLNHIAQLTRPDISFSVSSLARYSVKPGITHWHEVKKVWQYLRGTADLKLTLDIKEPDQLLQIYSDASWGDDPKDRTSQSGYLCFLFGTLISWNSSKQRSVTYSSTEAELNPLVDAFHEGLWLKAVLAEVWNIQMDSANHLIDDPDLLERLMMSDKEFNERFSNLHLIDNKGLDDKIKKFGSNPKTRHIDLKTKGIRQEVKSKNIRISLIKTDKMIADALTKAAPKSSILSLVKAIDPSVSVTQSELHQSPGVLKS
ncbi:hypothetical protein VP01_720g8 [Puccinia sorghi]|uniref:Integrase catalytic domain-containing protein n=1 Tax=Puccinia sorghi TaxID=27349 RepID=A0A0L6UDA9_9BASI|nr:hypothetical protein VP01_720g8 [Puccinia sorghi]